MRSLRLTLVMLLCMMFLLSAVISQDASPLRAVIPEDALLAEAHDDMWAPNRGSFGKAAEPIEGEAHDDMWAPNRGSFGKAAEPIEGEAHDDMWAPNRGSFGKAAESIGDNLN